MGKISLWFLKKGNSEEKIWFESDPPPFFKVTPPLTSLLSLYSSLPVSVKSQ